MEQAKISAFEEILRNADYETEHVRSDDPLVEDDHIKIKNTDAHVSLNEQDGFLPGFEKGKYKLVFAKPTHDPKEAAQRVMDLIYEHG